MLLFYCVPSTLDLETVARTGLRASAPGLHLHPTLDDARAAGDGPVLVVDATALELPLDTTDVPVRMQRVPPAALRNVGPYRPPTAVTAGGGYVTCALPDGGVALLLIYRRGVWDLPKGTRDGHEAPEACAVREVREEVGIDRLTVDRPLGTTQHAYPEDDAFAVKTTHWYLMRTPERSFTPQRAEGIRRVAPARWGVARRHIGYDTLRRHMDEVRVAVHAVR